MPVRAIHHGDAPRLAALLDRLGYPSREQVDLRRHRVFRPISAQLDRSVTVNGGISGGAGSDHARWFHQRTRLNRDYTLVN
jgi:hypothetical protein